MGGWLGSGSSPSPLRPINSSIEARGEGGGKDPPKMLSLSLFLGTCSGNEMEDDHGKKRGEEEGKWRAENWDYFFFPSGGRERESNKGFFSPSSSLPEGGCMVVVVLVMDGERR